MTLRRFLLVLKQLSHVSYVTLQFFLCQQFPGHSLPAQTLCWEHSMPSVRKGVFVPSVTLTVRAGRNWEVTPCTHRTHQHTHTDTCFHILSQCTGNPPYPPAWMGVFGEAQAYRLKSSVWKPARFKEGSDALRWIFGNDRARSSMEARICGKRGLSSLFFFKHSAISLFIAFGQLLRTLLRSGDRYPRPTIKIIWSLLLTLEYGNCPVINS